MTIGGCYCEAGKEVSRLADDREDHCWQTFRSRFNFFVVQLISVLPVFADSHLGWFQFLWDSIYMYCSWSQLLHSLWLIPVLLSFIGDFIFLIKKHLLIQLDMLYKILKCPFWSQAITAACRHMRHQPGCWSLWYQVSFKLFSFLATLILDLWHVFKMSMKSRYQCGAVEGS